MRPTLQKLALLSAIPITVALYLGIVVGVFAEAISAGVTALIVGVPLAVAAGLLVGRASRHSADAITNEAGAEALGSRLAPLRAKVTDEEETRFNIIHPGLDPEGSPADVAVINLARRLADRGHRPRLILLDSTGLARHWREQLAAHRGIGEAIHKVEMFDASGRAKELRLNPADRVIATDWTAAHVADDLCRRLRTGRFAYLIREYQPFEFSMGSSAALADQSYGLEHGAIFLDGLLQDYFSEQRLGVFATGPKLGLNLAVTCREPIYPVNPPGVEALSGHDRRRLLLPARPEGDGSGNLYELGIIALDLAVLNGHFRNWDLAGIGSGGSEETSIVLPRSRARLRLLPATEDSQRIGLLRQFDVGIGLRYAPGLAPMTVEMAASGMSVVTNTFAGKHPAALAAISENLLPADARVESIAATLAAAEQRSGDLDGRASGARIEWPTSWDETLDDAAMTAVEQLAS
ncbi:MAG: hypothetical protein M3Y45_03060 [Actinomycetota bacterium]|nr:hypothetical protein [Actinomycetota bacterium]